jgi:hypothetical protein
VGRELFDQIQRSSKKGLFHVRSEENEAHFDLKGGRKIFRFSGKFRIGGAVTHRLESGTVKVIVARGPDNFRLVPQLSCGTEAEGYQRSSLVPPLFGDDWVALGRIDPHPHSCQIALEWRSLSCALASPPSAPGAGPAQRHGRL